MQFSTIEAELHQREKERRRWRYENRTGAVHKRPNLRNRPAEARNGNSKRGAAARREATNRGNW